MAVSDEKWSKSLKMWCNSGPSSDQQHPRPYGVQNVNWKPDSTEGIYPLPSTKLAYFLTFNIRRNWPGFSFTGGAGTVTAIIHVILGSNWYRDGSSTGSFRNIIRHHRWRVEALYIEDNLGIISLLSFKLKELLDFGTNLVSNEDQGIEIFKDKWSENYLVYGGGEIGFDVTADLNIGSIVNRDWFFIEGEFPEDTGIIARVGSLNSSIIQTSCSIRTLLGGVSNYSFACHEPITGVTDYYYEKENKIWRSRSKTEIFQTDFSANGSKDILYEAVQYYPKLTNTTYSGSVSHPSVVKEANGKTRLLFYKNGETKGIYLTAIGFSSDSLSDEEYFGDEIELIPNASNPVSYYDAITGVTWVFGYLNSKIYATSSRDLNYWSTPQVAAPQQAINIPKQTISVHTTPDGSLFITYYDSDKNQINEKVALDGFLEEPATDQISKMGNGENYSTYNDFTTGLTVSLGWKSSNSLGEIFITVSRDRTKWSSPISVLKGVTDKPIPKQSVQLYKDEINSTNYYTILKICHHDSDYNWVTNSITVRPVNITINSNIYAYSGI